ncbi:extracellular solute-binding protein [Paenibacillus dokdonensis]|uniref:extracellular solute-binding protein n=1 Tax=Paenibacillus dokdonensis TaxID=2567944 RepID=UPI0010A8C2EE|nr:extracellular solute-binding protein [Paenibacillus dokdonensis]
MHKVRTIGLVLTLILSLGISACSSKTVETKQPAENAAAEKPEASKEQGVMEISTVRAQDPYLKFDEGESFDKNAVYDAYEKDTGVKIKNQWVVDGTVDGPQFQEKLKMAITTNDIPDLFPATPAQVQQLIEADMIQDLTSVYDQYASDETKEFMQKDGGIQMKSGTFDGKLMAIPQTGNPFSPQLVWVRSDWMKKLNLPEPKTMQDLMNIMEAFATKDPGGTGKSYGLALNKKFDEGALGLVGFMNGYHAYLNQWMEDGQGGLMNSDIQPEMKEALRGLQELFKKGLIDPEFAVKDMQKESELIFSNKIGVLYGAEWTPAHLAQAAVKDGKVVQEWSVYRLPSIDNTEASTQIELGTSSYYVVSKKAEHPEALIKLLNQWIAVDNHPTPEQKVYEYGNGLKEKGNNYWLLSPVMAFNLSSNNGEVLPKAIETKDQSLAVTKDQKTRYDRAMKYVNGEDITMWWEYLISGPNGAVSNIPYLKEHNLFHQNKFYGAPTPTMVEKREILNRKRDEIFMKIIMNQVSIDEFDKFVTEWKKLGGDDMTKEVNEWYAKIK